MTLDLAGCLRAKSEEGRITKDKAEQAINRFRELSRTRDNALVAGDQLAVEQAERLRRKQWTRLNELLKQNDAIRRIDENADRVSAGQLASSFFEFLTSLKVREKSISREWESVRANAQAMMTDVISRFEERAVGLIDPERTEAGRAKQENIVREAFGVDSGDPDAKELTKGIKEAMEYLRVQFNREGGNISFREDFGLPQLHDSNQVAQVSKDEWINRIWPLLDREKMIDENTGEPMTDDVLIPLLQDTYDAIVTSGLSRLDPTTGGIEGAGFVTKRQHMRFLQFRSPEDWIEYQRQFGPNEGNVVTTVNSHIDKMAADIATMRVLGPNPRATMQVAADTIKQRKGGVDTQDAMEALLRESTGEANSPADPNNSFWAGAGVARRNLLQSAILGQAFFSALTDFPFSQMAARFAGLPQTRLARRQMDLFIRQGSSRRMAMRLGLGAMGAVEKAQAAARVSGETLGTRGVAGATRRINDVVMRASLLQPWTESARWAFGTEFLATLTEKADEGATFRDLNPGLQRTFKRNGITEADWNVIRNSERFVDPETGADFIRPLEVRGVDEEVGGKLQRMISAEGEFAVPSNLKSARALLRQGTRPGTFGGELIRDLGLLKNFVTTVTMLQWGRFAQIDGGLNKLRYGGALLGTTGSVGVLAEQLDAIAGGQEPPTIDPTTVEGRSNLQRGLWRAGTFGVLGDLVLTDFEEFGSSVGSDLAGPVFSEIVEPGVTLTAGNVQTLFTEEGALREPLASTDAGRDLVSFAQGLTPGQNLWWAKLGVERMVFDQLQKLADPEAERSFRRQEQRAEEQGSAFIPGLEPGGF